MQPSNGLVRDCEVEIERCNDGYCKGKEVRLLAEEEKATLARIKVVMGLNEHSELASLNPTKGRGPTRPHVIFFK